MGFNCTPSGSKLLQGANAWLGGSKVLNHPQGRSE
jgi:hypothetical protein